MESCVCVFIHFYVCKRLVINGLKWFYYVLHFNALKIHWLYFELQVKVNYYSLFILMICTYPNFRFPTSLEFCPSSVCVKYFLKMVENLNFIYSLFFSWKFLVYQNLNLDDFEWVTSIILNPNRPCVFIWFTWLVFGLLWN